MFLMAFLVAFFIVSLVEVLRSSYTKHGAPEIQMASAVTPVEPFKTPTSFSDLAERVKPAVVNISTTRNIKSRGFSSPFGRSPLGLSAMIFLTDFLVIFLNANLSSAA